MLKEHKRKALPWMLGQVLVAALCAGLGTVAWASQGGTGVSASLPADADAQARHMAPPQYPKSAYDQRISGKVVLRVNVDARGRPDDIKVISSTPAGVFDDVSVAAARQWTFEPARKDGKPVATALQIPMTFELEASEPAS